MPPSKLIVTKKSPKGGVFFIRGGLLLRGGDHVYIYIYIYMRERERERDYSFASHNNVFECENKLRC